MFEAEVELPASAFPEAPVRAEDLRYIVGCVRQGQCCTVVGPSNMGKSLLLKSLPRAEVRLGSTREGKTPPVMVFVDCLEAGDSEHAFYELLLRRMVGELGVAGVPPSIVETVGAIHDEVLRSSTDLTVRSLFATSMREVDRTGDIRLVLILDEFDDVFSELAPWAFRQLRALRDAAGDRLCYITGTSRRLERLRSDAETYEFRELFHMHPRILRPLSEEDTRSFVGYLSAGMDLPLNEEYVSLLVELSGGHPGLLDRAYGLLGDVEPDAGPPSEATVSEFAVRPPIRHECQRLWDELEQEEQEGLLALIGGGEAALDDVQRQALEAKGLVGTSGEGGLRIFSLIFEAFVRGELARRQRPRAGGVRCDFTTGQIWADEREVTLKLSEAQRKLVRLLYQKGDAVCSYDEIAEEVWGVGEGVSPGAIYELVKRVRQKVEVDWRNPRYIVTVPGEGCRLEVRR